MKIFYHCLIMWIPFGLLFFLAGLGLEALEGSKIKTSEYTGPADFGIIYLLFTGPFAFMLYPISFLPLTFIVSKFIKSLLFKVIIFSFWGGVIGAFAFEIIYARFIKEYNLSMISSIIIFGMAGILYALVENSFKRNIKFA